MELAQDVVDTLHEEGPRSAETCGWTALVLAGERPGGDPLSKALNVPTKALIELQQITLLDHVLAALLEVPRIKRIVVLAQKIETLASKDRLCRAGHERVVLSQSGNGIVTSIEAVIGTSLAPWPILVTTADNALLTRERVETFLDRCHGFDISVGVGERRIVEGEFPETRRTWLKFSDGQFSGANLFALASPRCRAALQKWSAIENDRKKGLKLIASFGPALLLRALTRTIAFPEAIGRASGRLGCTAQPIVLDAEAPIDVDKPGDLELVDRILATRRRTITTSNTIRYGDVNRPGTPAPAISIFDVDRTLTRRPTYSAFLFYGALRSAPWRLAILPMLIPYAIAYAAGRISRKRMKEAMHWLALGGRMHRHQATRLAEDFAARLVKGGIYAEAFRAIEAERREGRLILIATAAPELYIEPLAKMIGADAILATRSIWDGDWLKPQISGCNCYGIEKRNVICDWFEAQNFERNQAHIRFFSDHASDLPTLEWVDEPVMVNASPRLLEIGIGRGWKSLDWARHESRASQPGKGAAERTDHWANQPSQGSIGRL